MGYRIVYGKEPKLPPKPSALTGRLRLMTAGFMLAGVVLVRLFWPEGRALLQEMLIPGPMNATEQAFSRLMTDLRLGEPVGEAVTAFCSYVIHNGG